MQLQEVGNEELEFLNKVIDFSVPGKNFVLKNDEKIIGYSRINNAEEDDVFIYIKEEYRGNGYGKELFRLTIDETEKEEFVFNVSKQNIQMIKIINSYKNKEILNNPKYIKYGIKK